MDFSLNHNIYNYTINTIDGIKPISKQTTFLRARIHVWIACILYASVSTFIV